jgi:NifU-like protein
MSFYPPEINERFLRPKRAGEIEFPSAIGTNGSFVCGAALKIFLQVEDGKITQAKFKAAGCGFLFAAADVLCEQIRNREFAEIGKAVRERESLFEALFQNEFPANRAHCLELCLETLHAAIDDYRAVRLESWNGDEALICTCFGVSESAIETAIRGNSLTSVEEVTEVCNAGGGCGSCQPLIMEILDDLARESI